MKSEISVPAADEGNLGPAREAGYSGEDGAMRVTAHRLAHDPRVQAAMLEEAQRRLGAALPLATAQLVRVLTGSTKNSEKLKAISMVYNRSGMPEKTEH